MAALMQRPSVGGVALARAIAPLAALVFMVALAPLSAQAPPARRALLIGINEYSSENVRDLRGAVNDVTMIRRILITRFGFAERDIQTLTDAQATRQGILAALESLVSSAGENDIVYIHFSGHGAQVDDFNGDEKDDRKDETLLPYDAREDDVPDIIDDELDSLFAKLRSRHALIVLDSCYSGTGTRAMTAVQPRSADPDTRTELYRRLFSSGTRALVDAPNLPHVLLTAAPPNQQALDGPVDGDAWYGLFSFSLARGLDALGPTATPVQLHDRALQELRRIQEQLFTTAPEPQLEAPSDRVRLPFVAASGGATAAASAAPARRAWLAVERIDDSHLRLVSGVDLNAQPGSLWGVFAQGETEFQLGNALALGRVERVQGRDAILVLQVRRGSLPQGARAIALAPRDASSTVPVRIDAPDDRRTRLERAIAAELASVRFVGRNDAARFVVALERGEWLVKDAGGLQTAVSFRDGADAALARDLAKVFSTSATAISLLALDNPASSLQVSVDVVAESDRGVGVVPASRAGGQIRQPGEPRSARNSLMLEVRVNRDAYLTIVDVDAEGGVNLLFPNDAQARDFLPEGRVRAGSVTRIPDSLGEGNRAAFHWDYTPPAGNDTIRVFATADLETARLIRRLAAEARQRREAIGELRSTLAERGVGVVPSTGGAAPQTGSAPAGDWDAASIAIDVRN